jgi:hypothetical protein
MIAASGPLAAIVDLTTLGRVVLDSLVFGIGVAVVFGLGVSSAASLAESMRRHRTAASIAWGALAVACVAGALAAVVLGIVVVSSAG